MYKLLTESDVQLANSSHLRQLLLLWQSLDDLTRLYQLTLEVRESSQAPKSIEEVLKHGI
ncbi:hypothetical protein [Paraglaciecola sp.]|uniref:hypothetical protein n=1 Tax=Paraglaciecola sp. TaxID=1920173 RepID=UPI00326743BD